VTEHLEQTRQILALTAKYSEVFFFTSIQVRPTLMRFTPALSRKPIEKCTVVVEHFRVPHKVLAGRARIGWRK
jgi:hypothetical protein